MKRAADVRKLAAIGAAEKKRLAREGKKLVALVVRLRREIQRKSFELGRALARLKDKSIIAALGFPSFHALCDTALRVSRPQGEFHGRPRCAPRHLAHGEPAHEVWVVS